MKFVCALLVGLLVGCAPTVKQGGLTIKQPVGKVPLYAKFTRDDNGLRIEDISEKRGKDYEPYIRINDLYPMFSTEEKNCVSFTMGKIDESVGEGCLPDRQIYREKMVEGGDAVVTGVVNLFSMGGLGGPNGKPIGVGRYSYTTYFDQDAYTNDITVYDNKTNLSKLVDLYEAKKSELELSIKDYENKIDIINYEVNINDKSGLYTGYISAFEKYIDIKTNNIETIDDELVFSIDGQNDPYSSLENNINKHVDTQKKYFTYNVYCKSGSHNGFNYTMSCEKNIGIEDAYEKHVANVTIHNKDISHVIPTYTFSDEQISARFESNQLNIENKTNSFLSIDSISIYLNKEIFTDKNLDIELPPNSIDDNVVLSSIIKAMKKIDYSGMNKTMAKSKKIDFGIAVKYRVVDTNKEKTLYKKKSFTLLDVVG